MYLSLSIYIYIYIHILNRLAALTVWSAQLYLSAAPPAVMTNTDSIPSPPLPTHRICSYLILYYPILSYPILVWYGMERHGTVRDGTVRHLIALALVLSVRTSEPVFSASHFHLY